MSLADACIVLMAEIHERHAVLTLDFDFSVCIESVVGCRLRSFTRPTA